MTYFEYWAAQSMETQYRHLAAAHGGIAMQMSLRVKRMPMNDGNTYTVIESAMADPLRPMPRRQVFVSCNPTTE